MLFEGTREDALAMLLLALVLGAVAGRLLVFALDARRHRQAMARLDEKLLAYEPEPDRFQQDLAEDHALGEHDEQGHWLCHVCQRREARLIDPGEGLLT